MSLNQSSITDAEGNNSDWIELYNSFDESVNLIGWFLSDEIANPQKWAFPSVVVQPNEYLIVFATGNDSIYSSGELHTNFKLSGNGEYLALVDNFGERVSEFNPFSELDDDQSFGFYKDAYIIFNEATPGLVNTVNHTAELPLPVFSHKHGFYETSFELNLTTSISGATIIYTLNGSEPSVNNGNEFTSAITIDTTSIVRAIVVSENDANSKIFTQSYLFLDDVIHQPNNPEGYPDHWGDYIEISGTSVADYEMDQEMMGDILMAQRVKEALISIPTMSLVSSKSNFFSTEIDENTGGIYVFTGPPGPEIGLGWERSVSMEYFDANDSISIQVNCGVRIHGGHSRRPEKSPKHSFRLLFKKEYGQGRFDFPIFGEQATDNFNSLVLRSGYGNTWIHRGDDERDRAQYGRDTWSKDTQLEMGQLSSNSNFVHLYINGIYWGIYNPGERLDSEFAESYMGGNSEDFDVIKDYAEALDGSVDAWNEMISMANNGLETTEAYQQIQGNNSDGSKNLDYECYVDIDNLIDYMLINFYGGNTDWDHHNWAAIRNREKPGKGFQFFCWDQEHVLKSLAENTTNEFNSSCPSNLFTRLKENEAFKRLFADKVMYHLTGNGILTPDANRERWMKRSSILEKAIDAESARWGDYRRDVHQYFGYGSLELYTKDEHWLPARDWLLGTYFEERTEIVLTQLRRAGLYPNIDGADFRLNSEIITKKEAQNGDVLSISAPLGTIYYSLNGDDPVIWDDIQHTAIVSNDAQLYTEPIILTKSVHLKARAFYNDEWSAMKSQFLVISDDFKDLKLTEIHYHPRVDDELSEEEYEFVELKNTGTSTIDIGGVQFIKGIDYTFPDGAEIKPQGFIVLAADIEMFYERYGFVPFDEFKGQLDNGGEKLILINPSADTLLLITYNDKNGWPVLADGRGHSMVTVDINPTNQQNIATDWRNSHYIDGSPGEDDLIKSDSEVYFIDDELIVQLGNYPNPFSSITNIDYRLNDDAFVEVVVYDLMGQAVNVLVKQHQTAGIHQAKWDGTKGNKKALPNGIYFYCVSVSNSRSTEIYTNKMMLMR